MPVGDIQRLRAGLGISQQQATEALRHAGGDLKVAFLGELESLHLHLPLLDRLVRDYATHRCWPPLVAQVPLSLRMAEPLLCGLCCDLCHIAVLRRWPSERRSPFANPVLIVLDVMAVNQSRWRWALLPCVHMKECKAKAPGSLIYRSRIIVVLL